MVEPPSQPWRKGGRGRGGSGRPQPRSFRRILPLSACLLLAGCADPADATDPTRPPPPTTDRPNLLLIVTDDQESSSLWAMKRTQELLVSRGLSFTRFYAAMPACCPSRASILTGRHVHNHQVWHNGPDVAGGFLAFHEQGHESATVATWLREAGYRTALVGKYLNFYGEVGPVHVPPGWDEWYAIFGPPIPGERQPYYGYFMNENGEIRRFGNRSEDYVTDVLAGKAVAFMQEAVADGVPFFLFWAPYAPHEPALPAPRHVGLFAGAPLPRLPSFDEADIDDKPPVVREPPLSEREIARMDRLYKLRLESLQAVDEAVESFVQSLEAVGALKNTYILFTSDNGFRFGQHRLPAGKGNLYEEEIRVPLIVRGPDVPLGDTVAALTSNVDLAPTLAELGGAMLSSAVDGVSLVPLLRGAPELARSAVLVERGRHAWAVRSRDHVYMVWPDIIIDGRLSLQREWYNMREDPYQLENEYGTLDPRFRARLEMLAAYMRTCVGGACSQPPGVELP